MRQYSHKFETHSALAEWLDACADPVSSSALIQIFSGVIDPSFLGGISQLISEHLPHAVIIGTTTGGEIVNGEMLDESVVISLSLFEQTRLKSIHFSGHDSEEMGRDAARAIIDEETKCVIMFADGVKCNGDAMLRGFNSACSGEIVVAGGMSGDNYEFQKSYCIHGQEVFEQGVVAVALCNPSLKVFHTYNLSWCPIGKKMTVTKSEGNVVCEIDGKPIREVYAKYLGDDVVQRMPASTIEFPLIMHQGEVDVARSMIAIPPDHEGIVYAGEIPIGSQVRFGIGSPEMLSASSKKSYLLARNNPIEGLFVYSCIARKTFLGKELEAEFSPLAKIAPLAGFFTYGEFYHGNDGNKLLNVTTTVLGLSETALVKEDVPFDEADFLHSGLTISGLMNLVNVTLQESEEYAQELLKTTKSLQLKDSALNAAANGIVITDVEGTIEWANEAYSRLTGYNSGEAIGFNPRNLVKSSAQDQTFYEILWSTILSKQIWHGELINRRKDGSLYHEEMTITPMMDEKGTIQHFVAVKQDITERKQMEELIHQFAFYDTLTRLPNRRLFIDRLTQAQSVSKRSGHYGAVMFLDLDNFKPLNDAYGHSVGDLLLVEVARRIKVCLRDSDTVARFGGDEFVVLLSDLSTSLDESIENAKAIAEKIRSTIGQPYFLTVGGEGPREKIVEHHCTSSIGVVLFLDYEADLDDILRYADNAMYRAKDEGKNKVLFYNGEEHTK